MNVIFFKLSNNCSAFLSSTHLSAILAHIGLASNHRPDVVIQAPIKCNRQRAQLE